MNFRNELAIMGFSRILVYINLCTEHAKKVCRS